MRRLLTSIFVAAAVAAPAAWSGCSNQAEGERCDTTDDNGGNDDCQNMHCTPKSELNGSPATDICCPWDRSKATTAVCALQPTPLNADGGVSNDGALGDAPITTDAPSESSADAPADSPVDSPSDAPTDAPDAG
jgi:hypothetical protein